MEFKYSQLLSEIFCKELHDMTSILGLKPSQNINVSQRNAYTKEDEKDQEERAHIAEYVDENVIIVGAGPAGLATAVCLQRKGVQGVVVLEKSACIASLWRERTYDRLCLHIPKQLSELPYMSFPREVPKYPTRRQFLDYLDAYACEGGIAPHFNENVLHAWYDDREGRWYVLTSSVGLGSPTPGAIGRGILHSRVYRAPCLVVASGENAEPILPAAGGSSSDSSDCCLPDLHRFSGKTLHSSQYKNGQSFSGQRVLVVGCGNSGMEVSLDLANYGAMPSVSVRSPVHVLPREIYGISTFSIAMALSRVLTLRWTDRLLLLLSRLVLGDPSSYGFKRPTSGPLELKETLGKTPLLDVGTLTKIKDGSIQVVPAVQRFTASGCFFRDGRYVDFDAVILATGYHNNVPSWLKVEGKCMKDACRGQWKSKNGLYFAGFNRKGLLGISMDARQIATEISEDHHTNYPLSCR
ncbi:hypothetical protein GOP47_0026685 [Adiantum capillus-veneris]|nr:hypothetical protein GOP47_0026685 [Adiantum capillus-veneris]